MKHCKRKKIRAVFYMLLSLYLLCGCENKQVILFSCQTRETEIIHARR